MKSGDADDDDDEDDGAIDVIMQGQIFEPSSSQRRHTLGITFTCGFGEHPILCWCFGLKEFKLLRIHSLYNCPFHYKQNPWDYYKEFEVISAATSCNISW